MLSSAAISTQDIAMSPEAMMFRSPEAKSRLVESQSNPATTVSHRPKCKTFEFHQDQPPHYRTSLSETVEDLSSQKRIDLSVKLSDISSESFFAIHFQQIKCLMIPDSMEEMANGAPSYNPNSSFLVYFRFRTADSDCMLNGPQVIGAICTKYDDYTFWTSY